jgi:hypothetical protein
MYNDCYEAARQSVSRTLFGTSDVSVAIRTFIKEPTPRQRERQRKPENYIEGEANLLSEFLWPIILKSEIIKEI